MLPVVVMRLKGSIIAARGIQTQEGGGGEVGKSTVITEGEGEGEGAWTILISRQENTVNQDEGGEEEEL